MNEQEMIDHALDLQATILSLQNKIVDLERQLNEANRLRELLRPFPAINPTVSESLEYLRIVAR